MPKLKVTPSSDESSRACDVAAIANAAPAAKLLRSLKIPKNELFTTELVSPAKAEKLTDKMKGKKMIQLQQLIGKPSGKPMAVPESDPRPSYQNDPLDDFSVEDLG